MRSFRQPTPVPQLDRELLPFLKEYDAHRKRARAGWSHRVWGRKLGLASGSLLSKVLRGERAISDDLFVRLTAYFGPCEATIESWLDGHLRERRERLRTEIREASDARSTISARARAHAERDEKTFASPTSMNADALESRVREERD